MKRKYLNAKWTPSKKSKMTRRRRRTKPRRSRTPKSLTNQYDFRNTHLSSRRKISSLDRKIYRIAHQNNGTRQRTFDARLTSATTGVNQQLVLGGSCGGFSTAEVTTGDITRAMTIESLTTANNTKLYLKNMSMTINIRNISINKELVGTIYRIVCSKRFAVAIGERNISEILDGGAGPVRSAHGWTPLLPVDKLSQYGVKVTDITKYTITAGETATYTDRRSLGSRAITSDLQGAFGDNEPGLSVHYIFIGQDAVGDTSTTLTVQLEFLRKYTYSVEGVPGGQSTIVYL